MAEADQRPTTGDYRAFLAAARLIEAGTRHGMPAGRWIAYQALWTLRSLFADAGLDTGAGGGRLSERQARLSSQLLFHTATGPLGDPAEDRFPAYSDDERARLVAAIDALDAALELGASLTLTPEREAEAETIRPEHARVVELKREHPNLPWKRIAAMASEETGAKISEANARKVWSRMRDKA